MEGVWPLRRAKAKCSPLRAGRDPCGPPGCRRPLAPFPAGRQLGRWAASWGLLLLLAACQQVLEADVTRFNRLPSDIRGETFVVLPDGGQDDSLEFHHYAQLVAAALQSNGLRPAPRQGPPARLVVLLHCGSVGSRNEYWFEPGTRWGGWGGVDDGTVDVYTYYFTSLDVELYDGPAWRQGRRRMLFEGRALGESEVGPLNDNMPYLVRALFAEFPGGNGRTIGVTVPMGG